MDPHVYCPSLYFPKILLSQAAFFTCFAGSVAPENDPANISIETEMAVEQIKEKHQQEVQDLKIQLETKVIISKLLE